MGDRYTLIRNCAYCGKQNDEIWFAPTCSFVTFTCEHCDRENFITSAFKVKRIEEITPEEVYDDIAMTSNMMEEGDIKRMARQMFHQLQKRMKR